MRAHSTLGRTRRSAAGALGVIAIALAGCTAALPTPAPTASPTASPTPPIICDDGPNAHTPMPADCVVPSDAWMPSPILPSLRAEPKTTPIPTLPSGLATLPPTTPWHGRTVYSPPSGASARLIGIGPDDTLYVLVARPLPVPKPTPTALFFVPDVAASVVAIRSDGSMRPGWPSAGVSVAGFPTSYKVNEDGTVFVASGPNPFGGKQNALSQLTITAIGSDGKVLPGWPYRTPAAQQPLDPELLVPGPGGMVCFDNVKPGVVPSGYDVPMVIYCLGSNGKLLSGWPYSGNSLFDPAVGPDGTVYVAQTTSTELTSGVTTFPFQVLAIGLDGKPKPGWTPWNRTANQGITTILPTKDGRVYMLLGGDAGTAQLVVVDGTGRPLSDRVESPDGRPNYKDAVLAADGTLVVATGDGPQPYPDLVNAYTSTGSQIAGWPQLIGGWGDVAVSPDGFVWVAWTVYGSGGASDESSVVALFDRDGNLQPGYPMASDYMISYDGDGLFVSSDGTAYASTGTASGTAIVAISR